MEPDWIAPSGLLRIKPSLPGIREHRLARRAIQEDFRNGMRHASKLARVCCLTDVGLRTAQAFHVRRLDRQKRNPHTRDASVVLR
jgi:hypothetical protein